MIPRTVLVAASAFDGALSAESVATAIAHGLGDGGRASDLCPLERASGRAAVGELLEQLDFDRRMCSAHALVLVESELHEDTLAGSVAFEIATRARQSGVPAYAVTGANFLDDFDARILDLQAIFEASTARALRAAGKQLAALM